MIRATAMLVLQNIKQVRIAISPNTCGTFKHVGDCLPVGGCDSASCHSCGPCLGQGPCGLEPKSVDELCQLRLSSLGWPICKCHDRLGWIGVCTVVLSVPNTAPRSFAECEHLKLPFSTERTVPFYKPFAVELQRPACGVAA